MDREGFEKLYSELPFSNRIIVKKLDSGGGLALIWKNNEMLEFINYTDNYILVKVKEDDGFEWWLTCFYGWREANQRYKSWELLGHLKFVVGEPWMCIGDFNTILQSSEKLSK